MALGGAVAPLFISHHSGLKPVDKLLASIDWATLLYFAAVFVLVGGLGAVARLMPWRASWPSGWGRTCWPAACGCCW